MNIPLLIANLLALGAFFLHTFMGDREIHDLLPAPESDSHKKVLGRWVMARGGWHIVSLDLLWVSVGMALINFTDLLPSEAFLLRAMAIYILGTAIVWLMTLVISENFRQKYLQLGQWMLLGVIGGLVLWASYGL